MAPQDTDNQDQTNSQDGDAQGEAATGVGAMLMATRLRIGDDLRDVAKTLHIRFIYLQAIEDGRYHDLPGSAYALGFIRSYADYLGLDSTEVVRRFKKEGTTKKGPSSRLVFPVPISESSMPGGAIVFIGFVIAILTYGGWYISTAKDGFLAELISPLPERLSALLPDDEKTEPVAEVVEEPAQEPPQETVAEPESAPEPTEQVVTETVSEQPSGEAAVSPEAVVVAVEPVAQPVQQAVEPIPEPAVEAVREAVVVEQQPVTPVVNPEPQAPVVEPAQQVSAQLAEPVVEVVPATPTPTVTPDLEPEVVTVTPVSEPAPVTQPTPVTEVEVQPEPVEPVMADGPAFETPPEPVQPVTEVATATATQPEGRVYGVEDNSFRVEVKALKNSWIQVRDDVANTLILTRLLRVGDSYRVPDRQGLKLLTGNAGALEIFVDGKSVPAIGSSGAVRRSVALDPDRLVQGQAVE